MKEETHACVFWADSVTYGIKVGRYLTGLWNWDVERDAE